MVTMHYMHIFIDKATHTPRLEGSSIDCTMIKIIMQNTVFTECMTACMCVKKTTTKKNNIYTFTGHSRALINHYVLKYSDHALQTFIDMHSLPAWRVLVRCNLLPGLRVVVGCNLLPGLRVLVGCTLPPGVRVVVGCMISSKQNITFIL